MSDRDKSTRDKVDQQQKTSLKDIEQDIFKLNVDEEQSESSFNEKSFKQQNHQIIQSEVLSILCENFSNAQITELMILFEKKFDKRFSQHVSSLNAKINVIESQLVTVINAHAKINKRLNELFSTASIENSQRLLINQIFQQESFAFKRLKFDNDTNNHKLLDNDDDDAQNENNSSITLSFRRKTLFDSDSFHNSAFYNSALYNSESFDFTEYIFRIIQQSSFKFLIVEQMNYFDSKKNVKSNNTITKISFFFDSMITVDKHIYYKNVYVFVNRLKNQIQQHDHD